MSLRKTYFIEIDRNAHWATQDDDIAAKTAKQVAQEQGGCRMWSASMMQEAGTSQNMTDMAT